MGKEESGLRKILIVEDDKVLNKTLAYNLTADGYEVTAAYSFQDAVERLKKSEFDIALLDINLPDGNGKIKLIEKLLSAPFTQLCMCV